MLPLSAAVFRSQRRNATPQCPPRLVVQQLVPVLWTRVPDHALVVQVDRPDDRQGWTVQCSDPQATLILHIPEQNRSEVVSRTMTGLGGGLKKGLSSHAKLTDTHLL